MDSKPHRTNSDFQLRYFMAGSCHTPDGAWMLMYAQKIAIEGNLRHAEAQRLRRDAKIAEAQSVISNFQLPEYSKMFAKAAIIEAEADRPIWELNFQAAKSELATIEKIMEELHPLRKFGHLPTLEANEAAQRDEWLGELIGRAENYLFSQGYIPADHFGTMRCHPDFEAKIAPRIHDIIENMQSSRHSMQYFARTKAPVSPISMENTDE